MMQIYQNPGRARLTERAVLVLDRTMTRSKTADVATEGGPALHRPCQEGVRVSLFQLHSYGYPVFIAPLCSHSIVKFQIAHVQFEKDA